MLNVSVFEFVYLQWLEWLECRIKYSLIRDVIKTIEQSIQLMKGEAVMIRNTTFSDNGSKTKMEKHMYVCILESILSSLVQSCMTPTSLC